MALQAACPKRFRLAAGSLKAQSLVAWEGATRLGTTASACSVTGGAGARAQTHLGGHEV